jgi:hypothetical protein
MDISATSTHMAIDRLKPFKAPAPVKISEAPQKVFDAFVAMSKKFLAVKYAEAAATSDHPACQPYAQIRVNGQVVAEIDNNGFIKSSNGLRTGNLAAVDGNLKGPALAQARADHLAGLLGGEVVKAPTALTPNEFSALDKPESRIDTAAMQQDALYRRLQKIEAARTLFLSQQICQTL